MSTLTVSVAMIFHHTCSLEISWHELAEEYCKNDYPDEDSDSDGLHDDEGSGRVTFLFICHCLIAQTDVFHEDDDIARYDDFSDDGEFSWR